MVCSLRRKKKGEQKEKGKIIYEEWCYYKKKFKNTWNGQKRCSAVYICELWSLEQYGWLPFPMPWVTQQVYYKTFYVCTTAFPLFCESHITAKLQSANIDTIATLTGGTIGSSVIHRTGCSFLFVTDHNAYGWMMVEKSLQFCVIDKFIKTKLSDDCTGANTVVTESSSARIQC